MKQVRRFLFSVALTGAVAAAATAQTQMQIQPVNSGYADVNGLKLYYAVYGEGEPLILLHGGLGHSETMSEVIARLADTRQVIAADLQGHGRTGDIDRPITFEAMAEDIAGLIDHLDLKEADVMGYSLGGGVALRLAIQRPEFVRKLVVVSAPYARRGWYPEIREQMEALNAESAEQMKLSPLYQSYVAVAPEPDGFGPLLDKMHDLLSPDYDWSEKISSIASPTMLIFADHDAAPPSHAAEFFALLGGGQKDAGWEGAGMTQHRLVILPGLTHYNVFYSPALTDAVEPFLSGEADVKSWGG